MRAPPLDYAVDPAGDDDAPAPGTGYAGDITLGTVFDRHAAALPVTEAMIRDAWRRMESEQRLGTDAADERGAGGRAASPGSFVGVFGRTLRRFRPNA